METQTLFEAAEATGHIAVIAVPMPKRSTFVGDNCHIDPHAALRERRMGLTREHPPAVREILRRAGLSMAAELTPDEIARAREAAEKFQDPRTRTDDIRRFIIPPVDGEGVTG